MKFYGDEYYRTQFIQWILFSIVLLLSFFRILIAERMFFDGIIYASIARNMAEGVGSLWRPYFSETLFPLFAEHPPLAFWAQAALFRILGDGIWIEKTYSLVTLLICGVIFIGIWRQVTIHLPGYRQAAALPLALALLAGPVGWTFAQNMLESTLTVFTSFAVWIIVCANREGWRLWERFGLVCCAGVAIVLAVMTKGPVGLFPLAAFMIHWITVRQTSLLRAVVDTIVCSVMVVVLLGVLWAFPESQNYMVRYADAQLLASLSGARGNSGGGWLGLISLGSTLVLPFLVAGALALGGHRANRKEQVVGAVVDWIGMWRAGAFFALLALSASLPILLSPRISSFYFTPSLPYYALALAVWSSPGLLALLRVVDRRYGNASQRLLVALTVVFVLILFTSWGRQGGERDIIHDVDKVGGIVCERTSECREIIQICDGIWQQWSLHAYFQRRYRISLERENVASTRNFILWSSACNAPPPEGVEEVQIGLAKYRLFLDRR